MSIWTSWWITTLTTCTSWSRRKKLLPSSPKYTSTNSWEDLTTSPCSQSHIEISNHKTFSSTSISTSWWFLTSARPNNWSKVTVWLCRGNKLSLHLFSMLPSPRINFWSHRLHASNRHVVHWLCLGGNGQRRPSLHGRLSNRPAHRNNQGVGHTQQRRGWVNEQKLRYAWIQQISQSKNPPLEKCMHFLILVTKNKRSFVGGFGHENLDLFPHSKIDSSRGPLPWILWRIEGWKSIPGNAV